MKKEYCLNSSSFEHLHVIFLLKFIKVKIKKIIAKIARGILVYSKFAKQANAPLDIPNIKNKNAGKQHIVDKSAVNTAPNIINEFFIILFLEKYMYK